ncbi:MAG: hypothetical protein RIG82_08445 [Phycisphaeraceae bacterium]
MVLTGNYEHTIDSKNRLAIPADLRNAVQQDAPAADGDPLVFYVNPAEQTNCLRLFPETAFKQRAQQLETSSLPPDELLAYEETFFGLSFRVETDRQGRVRLPEVLLNAVNLGRDVALIGRKDHIVLMPQNTWRSTMAERLSQPALFRNPRAAMGPANQTD